MVKSPGTTSSQFKSLWQLGGLTFSQLCRRVFNESIANNVITYAAALAYYCLFALFPLILIMMTLFGLFLSHSGELQERLLSYFEGFLPSESFQLLSKVSGDLATHASRGKLTVGIVFALWCVSGGVNAMISSLNLAYHVKESRSWFKVRTIALGLSVLIVILLLLSMFLALAGRQFIEQLGIIEQLRSGLRLQPVVALGWRILRWPAIILFVTASCSLMYSWGPDLKECRRGIWYSPGSAFGVFVLIAGSFVFRIYLHFFNNYSVTYGSLGALMILLVWLYVAGLAYVIGGVINAEIERAEKANELGIAAARIES